jgi:hypothetical protein
MKDYKNLTVANCRVSKPILYPDHQDVPLNGLAFSATMGMIHQINSNNQQDWKTWLGTQA